MEKHNSIILIDYVKCSPCSGLVCVGVCPFGIFEVGKKGKPQIVEASSCTRCGVCANLCPANAIIINQAESEKYK